MTLKLNGSSSGSVALDAPASTTSGADITFKLPVADGSAGQVLQTDGSGNLSWVTRSTQPSIILDRWRNTTTLNTDHHVTTSWERGDTANRLPAQLLQGGSGMSHSSGIFTFPSTGIWEVAITGTFAAQSGTDNLAQIVIQITSDNGSNWHGAAKSTGGSDGTEWFQSVGSAIFDITDTSQQKVRTYTDSMGYTDLRGNSDEDETYLTFIRWGDT